MLEVLLSYKSCENTMVTFARQDALFYLPDIILPWLNVIFGAQDTNTVGKI